MHITKQEKNKEIKSMNQGKRLEDNRTNNSIPMQYELKICTKKMNMKTQASRCAMLRALVCSDAQSAVCAACVWCVWCMRRYWVLGGGWWWCEGGAGGERSASPGQWCVAAPEQRTAPR